MKQMGSDSSGSQWISALDAARLVALRLGSEGAAKDAIGERLRDCALEASCSWYSEGADIDHVSSDYPIQSDTLLGTGYAWTVSPQTNAVGKAKLGWRMWVQSHNWNKDVGRWRWREGLFITSAPPQVPHSLTDDSVPLRSRVPIRFVASGVHFRKSQIIDLAGFLTQAARSPAGRKPADVWSDWTAEIVLMEHEGEIDLTITPDKLLAKVADRLAERGILGPDRAQTYPRAKAVVEVLRNRGNLTI